MFTEPTAPRKLKTALYGRTSHDDPRTVTIQIQQDMLTEWAETDPWVDYVVDTFWDGGVSGKIPLWDRPEGKRLLALVESGQIEAVAVAYADRWGRTLRDGLNAVERLERAGVRLVTVNEGWDGRLNHDPMWFHLRMVFAEEEHRRICKRMRDGREKAMRRDNAPPTGSVAFGYTTDSGGRYVVDPVEGPVVIQVYERCLLGQSNEQILAWCKTLNIPAGRKYRSRTEGHECHGPAGQESAQWHFSKISKILKNRVYLGERRWGARTFSHPALVDQTSFDRVQAIIEGRKGATRRPSKDPPKAMLSGLLRCASCGGRFYFYKKRSKTYAGAPICYPMYGCVNIRSRPHCKAKLLPIEWMDSQVWGVIESFLADPEALVRKVIARGEDLSGQADSLRQEEAELLTRLAKLDSDAAEVWAEQKTNGWPMAWVSGRLNELTHQKDGLLTSLASVRQQIAAISLTRDESDAVAAALAGIRAKLAEGLSVEKRAEICRMMLADGVVETFGEGKKKRGEVRITLRWGEGCVLPSVIRSLPEGSAQGSEGVVAGIPLVFVCKRAEAS